MVSWSRRYSGENSRWKFGGFLEFVDCPGTAHRTSRTTARGRDVEDVGTNRLFREAGEVVVLAAVAGAHQGDLRVAGIAEQVAVRSLALGLGAELIHVLDRVAGAAQLPGHVVQGAGLAHASGFLGLEFTLGDPGEFRHGAHLGPDDFRGALGAIGGPVLVAAEVEVVGRQFVRQLFIGQRRQVRHHVPSAKRRAWSCSAQRFQRRTRLFLRLSLFAVTRPRVAGKRTARPCLERFGSCE